MPQVTAHLNKAQSSTVGKNGESAGHGKPPDIMAVVDEIWQRHQAQRLSPAEEKDRRTVFTAAELVAMDLPPPVCVVQGIIPTGLTILASRPKLGKSWLGMGVGIAVATGGIALGNVPVTEGDVLYLALEDNRRRLKSRLVKLLAGADAPKRLTLATEWLRLDCGGTGQIIDWIESVEKPTLVVLDTLAKMRAHSRVHDRYHDDYSDIGQIKDLSDEHEFGILGIHHTRKPIQGTTDFLDEVSGTTGITGAADTVLTLKRERGEHDACLHVTGRDIDERELGLKFDDNSGRWTILGDAKELRLSAERREVLDCLREAGKPLTPTDVASRLGKKVNNIKQLLYQMGQRGEAKNVNGTYTLQ
jgi:hypothetical protein